MLFISFKLVVFKCFIGVEPFSSFKLNLVWKPQCIEQDKSQVAIIHCPRKAWCWGLPASHLRVLGTSSLDTENYHLSGLTRSFFFDLILI